MDGARIERPGEGGLLAQDRAQDLGLALAQDGIRVAHRLDDDRRGLHEERLAAAQESPMPDRATHDAPQDVAPTLVGWQHAIGDEERDGPGVIGDDLVAESLRLEGVRIVAKELAHPRQDGREQVRVVIRRDTLQDRGEPLQAQPGVDARERQRCPPLRALVELHEHQVPDLQPAGAVLAVIGHAVRALREVRPAVVVDLAAGPARTRLGHPPEVLVVAMVDIAPASHTLRRQSDLVPPDRPRLLVVGVGGRGEAVGLNACISRCLSAAFMRPCTRPMRTSGSAADNISNVVCAACATTSSESSISVHTQYACRPSAQALRMRSISSGRRSALSATVCTGVRPGGSSSIADTSRSAYAAIAKVRGIGVAVSTSWCGTRLLPGSPRLRALVAQRQPLVHAETMLLVDDRQREIVERHAFLHQRLGPDHDLRRARGHFGQRGGRAPCR